MKDPDVVLLHLVLYGHPDAGACWEKRCDAKLVEKSFSPVPSWPGCYVHKELAVFLTVYVDKMSCPKTDLERAWKPIREVTQPEPPTTGRWLERTDPP